jgi:hypothetical protein
MEMVLLKKSKLPLSFLEWGVWGAVPKTLKLKMEIKTYTRTVCIIEGCNKQTRNKGLYKNRTRYDNVCVWHHKKSNYKPYFNYRKKLPNMKCEKCGWDKAPCDRHRKIPMKGYIKSNVIILCPNCHREEETKKYDNPRNSSKRISRK